MIARLSGVVVAQTSDAVILDVHGVGYEVHLARALLAQQVDGAAATFFTCFIVREDAHTLYGFDSLGQRSLFTQLIAVSGIGPKVAMSLLSSLSEGDLRHAVAAGDVARLSKVPGIGKKTAERLILEMKGKLDLRGTATTPVSARDNDLYDILLGLGYSAAEANAAVAAIPADAPDTIDDRIRLALRYFGGV
jgi:Holliday junction DNA helicase RuvA